jgi:hypothetical protein
MTEIANIINQLETQKAAIEQALEALRDFGETGSITPRKSVGKAAPTRKGGMTPEGRRRLALAMKRRWAAKRTGAQAKKSATKKKTGLTAAGRRELAESMKRRWAAKRSGAQAKKKAA